ncbi:MAG: (Fe-S)-binding protein [Anaerolineae bacterium]
MGNSEPIRPALNLPVEMQAVQEAIRACYQCGTCSATCPTSYAMDYSPRALWRLAELGQHHEVLNSNTFWMCTACYSCTVRCPRNIPITDVMRQLREVYIQQGVGPLHGGLGLVLGAVATQRNIANEPNETRLIWSDNLPQRPPQLEARQAEVLYFVGCVGALFPQAYAVPQSFVQILGQAGVDYAVLGPDEWCCGYPVYSAGMKERMKELAEHNIACLVETGAKTLVTTCPSCYYTWHHLYPEILGRDVPAEVLHATEFIAHLINEGQLKLGPVEDVVTYHDPCDLGRKSGIYEAPRQVLRRIPGLTFREMAQHGPDSLCCGGGGDIAMYALDVAADVAQRRMRQAELVGARYLVSACQQCKRTLADGARRARIRIRPLDITELVWQSIQNAQAGVDLPPAPEQKVKAAQPKRWGEV